MALCRSAVIRDVSQGVLRTTDETCRSFASELSFVTLYFAGRKLSLSIMESLCQMRF